ncbi:MAG: glutathione S-transferase family protein [Polyangiales bacterium]
MTERPFLHYAAEVSLYSGKTRAYLRYRDVPFREVPPTLGVYRKVIVPNVGRPIIPVLQTPEGEILQDTTVIIDALEARLGPSVYPTTPAQRLVALLFELYGDEWLVMPAMHYRWHFKRENLAFILREFGEAGGADAPKWVRPLFGVIPALVFGGQYARYFGISRRNWSALEGSYEGFLRDFDAHLAVHPYLLGTRPSIGDFGLVAPLYAHLYRDPAPGKLMRAIAPNVARWVERMQHPPTPNRGAFLDDDAIPPTLDPMLRRMFTEQLPVLVDTVAKTDAWSRAHPSEERVPRVIGAHRYRLGDVEEERAVTPYSQWMFQRALDAYAALDEATKARVDPWLHELGGLPGLATPVPTRVAYRRHRVVVDRG